MNELKKEEIEIVTSEDIKLRMYCIEMAVKSLSGNAICIPDYAAKFEYFIRTGRMPDSGEVFNPLKRVSGR